VLLIVLQLATRRIRRPNGRVGAARRRIPAPPPLLAPPLPPALL
jgi:hypothetical protein